MKTVVDGGLVTGEKRSPWVWYRLVPKCLEPSEPHSADGGHRACGHHQRRSQLDLAVKHGRRLIPSALRSCSATVTSLSRGTTSGMCCRHGRSPGDFGVRAHRRASGYSLPLRLTRPCLCRYEVMPQSGVDCGPVTSANVWFNSSSPTAPSDLVVSPLGAMTMKAGWATMPKCSYSSPSRSLSWGKVSWRRSTNAWNDVSSSEEPSSVPSPSIGASNRVLVAGRPPPNR